MTKHTITDEQIAILLNRMYDARKRLIDNGHRPENWYVENVDEAISILKSIRSQEVPLSREDQQILREAHRNSVEVKK